MHLKFKQWASVLGSAYAASWLHYTSNVDSGTESLDMELLNIMSKFSFWKLELTPHPYTFWLKIVAKVSEFRPWSCGLALMCRLGCVWLKQVSCLPGSIVLVKKRDSNKKVSAEGKHLSSSVSERNKSGQWVNVWLRRGGLWDSVGRQSLRQADVDNSQFLTVTTGWKWKGKRTQKELIEK